MNTTEDDGGPVRLITNFSFPSPEKPFYAVDLHYNERSLIFINAPAEIVFQQGRGFRRRNHCTLSRTDDAGAKFIALPVPITGDIGISPVAVLLFHPVYGVLEVGTTISSYALIAMGKCSSYEEANEESSRITQLAYRWVEKVNGFWGHSVSRTIVRTGLKQSPDALVIEFYESIRSPIRIEIHGDEIRFPTPSPWTRFSCDKKNFRLHAVYVDFGVSPNLVPREGARGWEKDKMKHYAGDKL